jgi:hypothetical protein
MNREHVRRLSKRQKKALVEATTGDGRHATLALDIQPPLRSGDRITLSGKVSPDTGHGLGFVDVKLTIDWTKSDVATGAGVPGEQPKKALKLWYEERVALWSDSNAPPSRGEDCVAALQAGYTNGGLHRRIESLRRQLAPLSWVKSGPKRPKA